MQLPNTINKGGQTNGWFNKKNPYHRWGERGRWSRPWCNLRRNASPQRFPLRWNQYHIVILGRSDKSYLLSYDVISFVDSSRGSTGLGPEASPTAQPHAVLILRLHSRGFGVRDGFKGLLMILWLHNST